ncbi:hypothetical protein JCM11251_007099 [Rhodosporidiobolus azoricus]
MGLFNKKQTSPSGYFTVDESDAHHPSKERKSSDSGRRKSMSTTSPRTSTSNDTSNAAAATRGAEAAKEQRAEGGSKTAAALAGAKTAATEKHDEKRESQVPLTSAGRKETDHIDGANAVATGVPSGVTAPSSSTDRGSSLPATGAAAATGLAAGAGARRAVPSEHVHETAIPPKHGHHHSLSKDAILDEAEAKRAGHDHQYLEPVVHERRHVHEVEEVERHRVVDRHVHHVQHHVQPLLDERHLEVVHSYREVPMTHIQENHAATPADAALLARLNAQSASTYTVVPHERVVIDKGETQVVQNVINHYHTIVLPVWQRDLHEYYRLSSTFPLPPNASTANVASPSVQAGATPLTPSMLGPAQAREGHKLVPNHEKGAATYEVEFVNRQPVVPGKEVVTGLGGADIVGGKGHSNLTHSHIPATVGGDAPSAAEHYPAGSQGVAVREATGLTGTHGAKSGLEKGMQEMRVGEAK